MKIVISVFILSSLMLLSCKNSTDPSSSNIYAYQQIIEKDTLVFGANASVLQKNQIPGGIITPIGEHDQIMFADLKLDNGRIYFNYQNSVGSIGYKLKGDSIYMTDDTTSALTRGSAGSLKDSIIILHNFTFYRYVNGQPVHGDNYYSTMSPASFQHEVGSYLLTLGADDVAVIVKTIYKYKRK
jgi:hypothetical protein